MKRSIKRGVLLLLMTALLSGVGFSITDNTAFAEGSRTILAFTSDVHNNAKDGATNKNAGANRLQAWITNEQQAYDNEIDYMGFCGDMSATSNVSENQYWANTKEVMDVADAKFPGKVCYTTGNHEIEQGKFNDKTTNPEIKNRFTVDAVASGAPSGCQVYCMGSLVCQPSNNNYVNEYLDSQVTELQTFLNGCDASKPVFILSHYPLHYYKEKYASKGRYTTNADKIIDALNTAADRGMLIVFLWGHNHTNGDSNYDRIIKPNDSIQYDDNSSHKKTINFAYAAAGCMSDSEYSSGSASVAGKGLIVEVKSDKTLTFTYYDANKENVTSGGTQQVTPPAPSYTVQFDANGHGTAPASQTVTSGSKLTKPSDPAAEGHFFGGWFTDAACTDSNEWHFDTDTVTEGRTLYAKWTADTTVYSISYDLDDGSLEAGKTNPTQYKETSAAITLNNPVKSHYTFKGWTGTGLSSAAKTVTIPTGSTGNRSYKATWTPDTYKVTFSNNDSRATGTMSSQNYTYGTEQKLTKNGFTKPCYNFVEWNTKANGTGTSYSDQASIAVNANMTLYAQWAEGSHSWNAGVVTTEPTTEHAGEKTYTCTVCHATKKETLDPLSPGQGDSGGGSGGGDAGGGAGGGDAGGGSSSGGGSGGGGSAVTDPEPQPDPQAENQATAEAVIDAIAALPAEISPEDEAAVAAARAAYQMLTEEQKALVPDAAIQRLEQAETTIADWKAYYADAAAAQAIETKVMKLKNSKGKKLTVSWKRLGLDAGNTGYLVRYSTDKKLKKGVKTKTVKGAAKNKLTLKNLKKGKTYYVTICAYTKVSNNVTDTEETICGKWTKVKKVKIKK